MNNFTWSMSCHDELLSIINLAVDRHKIYEKPIVVCKRKRDLKDGDFTLPQGNISRISNEVKEEIKEDILQKLSHGPWKVSHISFPSFCFLSLHLNKPTVYRSVLTPMVTKDVFQKVLETEQRTCVMMHIGDQSSETSSVEDLRILIIAQHIFNLLSCNGFDVKFVSQSVSKSKRHLMERIGFDGDKIVANTSVVGLKFSDVLEKYKLRNNPYIIYKEVVKKHDSQCKQDPCDSTEKCENEIPTKYSYSVLCKCAGWAEDKVISANGNSVDDICIDVKSYMKDASVKTGRGNYEKSIELLTLSISEKNGRCTDLMKEVIFLHDSVLMAKGKVLLHLDSEKRFYHQQKLDLLLNTLFGRDLIKQVHVSCGLVTSRQGTNQGKSFEAEDFISSRLNQMKDAAVMKYGDKVSGSNWEETIHKLTMASLKFEFLTTSLKNKVKLDLSSGQEFGGGVDNRAGAFVMYNCARLATLFKHFEESVSRGTYPPLPEINNIDFSTLKEENEWELFFNYIFVYNEMVLETTENCVPEGSIISPLQTHKVANFLISLSRHLSSYYSRTHILGENRPHLLPMMYARLYLLKVTHKVMCHALNLMGIQPLNQL